MPIVGAIIVVLLAIGMSSSVAEESLPVADTTIQVIQGKQPSHADFKYIPLHLSEPVTPEPQVPARPFGTPRVIVTPPRQVELPLQVAPTTQELVVESQTAVGVCLGKVAGAQCTFSAGGATKEGTCLTIAWSPLTCVPH